MHVGMTPVEAVQAGLITPFIFRLVQRRNGKTEIESCVEYICEESPCKNVVVQSQTIPESCEVEQLFRAKSNTRVFRYDSDAADKKTSRDTFASLCNRNLRGELQDDNLKVVLLTVGMLDYGADLPFVDQVFMNKTSQTHSQICDADKIMQACRHTRSHPYKKATEMVLLNDDDHRKGVAHFVEKYDENMQVTQIFCFSGDDMTPVNMLNNCLPIATSRTAVDKWANRTQTMFRDNDVLLPFLAAFPDRPPKKDEKFHLMCNGVSQPLNGSTWCTRLTNFVKAEQQHDLPNIEQVQQVVWFWKRCDGLTKWSISHA